MKNIVVLDVHLRDFKRNFQFFSSWLKNNLYVGVLTVTSKLKTPKMVRVIFLNIFIFNSLKSNDI